VTGHSLGGTLAQITAHHYGLRGEAFNPYGSTALDRHIPSVNGNFTSHFLAGDVVSSGAPHYGKTVVYATAQDVTAIKAHNIARHLVPGSTTVTAGALMGDHSITNFTGHDGHFNILTDPQAGVRATQNWSAIQNYRNDVAADRQLLGAALISPTGIKNAFNDLFSENTSTPSPAKSQNLKEHYHLTPNSGEYGFGADASQPCRSKAHDYHDILSRPLADTASPKEMIAYATAAFLSDDDSLLHGRLNQVANNHAFIKSMQHAENFVIAVETHQQLQVQNQEASSPSRSMRM
jgi:hypothetical protein